MRIATYDVNGVNGRLPVVLRWLAETDAHVRGWEKTSDVSFAARKPGNLALLPA